MTKQEFVTWAESVGFKQDTYGHYQKTQKDGRKVRLKLSSVAVRYEVQVKMPDSPYQKGKNEWVRIRSGYYSKLSINAEGSLVGLTR